MTTSPADLPTSTPYTPPVGLDEPSSGLQPTHVRYGVLGFACALSMITYLDRVCFGAAASSLIRDLGLNSEADLKWAFTAFGFAYAAFEVPSGWLGDVFGPRKTLIRIVLWWSIFTALTGTVGLHVSGVTLGGLYVLIVIRFLFGMGEAGAYPNITPRLAQLVPLPGTRLHPRHGLDVRPTDGRADAARLDRPGRRRGVQRQTSQFAAHRLARPSGSSACSGSPGALSSPGGSATGPKRNRPSMPPSWN